MPSLTEKHPSFLDIQTQIINVLFLENSPTCRVFHIWPTNQVAVQTCMGNRYQYVKICTC